MEVEFKDTDVSVALELEWDLEPTFVAGVLHECNPEFLLDFLHGVADGHGVVAVVEHFECEVYEAVAVVVDLGAGDLRDEFFEGDLLAGGSDLAQANEHGVRLVEAPQLEALKVVVAEPAPVVKAVEQRSQLDAEARLFGSN